jgi:predicted heme/steroid binding protein
MCHGTASIHNILISAFLLIFLLAPAPAQGTPEFSERTEQGCQTCHVDPEEGSLRKIGLEFAASGYVWPPTGGYRVLGPIRRSVRFGIGLMHILAAFMWFGTILYVHLILRPAYAAKGLPKVEVAVGMMSMLIVGVSGALLTLARIRSFGVLFNSPWGIVLSIKIALYLFMISTAAFVILFVGPKLKTGKREADLPRDGIFDPVTLAAFDGRSGKPVYAAQGGKVYDLSASPLWKGGKHMTHSAGEDLTSAIGRAPHGEEKLEAFTAVGSYDASRKVPKTAAQKTFYFIAYLNLALVFAVLTVIAFWRWGI